MKQKMRDPASLNKLFSSLDEDTTYNSSFEQEASVTFLGAKSTYMFADNIFAALRNTLSTNSLFSTFCINIRSLANSNNFDNLSCAINSMKYFPDVIGITETWLKYDFQGSFLNFPNYNFISSARSKLRGGVGFYIQKNFSYWLRNDITIFDESCLESMFVEIKLMIKLI